MNNIIPSLNNLLKAVCASIHTHPLIKDPPIYHSINNGEPPQQIKINRYRTYGGMELINIGELTCAVYPAYVPRNNKTGHPTVERDMQKSIVYTPYELGNISNQSSSLDKVKINIVVELHYHEVAIGGNPVTVDFLASSPLVADVFNNTDPNSYGCFYLDKNNHNHNQFSQSIETTDTLAQQFSNQPNRIITPDSFLIDINPAEDMLRDYMELLRIVLNQTSLNPFGVKHSYVKNIDFPTNNWLENRENVYFHMAYLILEVEMYLPCTNYLFTSSNPVRDINIKVENL